MFSVTSLLCVHVLVIQGPPENQPIAEVATLPKESYLSIYMHLSYLFICNTTVIAVFMADEY